MNYSKTTHTIGWMATGMAVIMYISFIDLIRLNLSGHKGSKILPAIAIVNCILWIAYAVSKPKRDWPIIVANVPGVFLGAIAFVTAF